jgi:hypothetical protein
LKQYVASIFRGDEGDVLQNFGIYLHAHTAVQRRRPTSTQNDVFENRVLRIIFGNKRDEVTGVWRTL